MTRLFPLLGAVLLLASGGCVDRASTASTPSTPEADDTSSEDGDFDGRAWLDAANEVAFDLESEDPDDAQIEAVRALSAELGEVVDWKRGCDTYLDYETGEPVYDPIPDDVASWVRGLLSIGMISDSEAVVAVTCDYGAYQGSYALVHVRENGATLLRARALGEKGLPVPRLVATFSTPDWDDLGSGIVRTFGLAR
ncbi:MAG: hypothetical protein AAFQ43_09575, partial [Bacteroidota bacterium]